MGKITGKLGNDFCPQALFLYGNYQEDGRPHFGLYCWATYCHIQDGEEEGLGFLTCIGEEKLTKGIFRQFGHPGASSSGRLLRHHQRPGSP